MGASAALPVIVNREGGAARAAGDSLAPTLRDAFAAAGRPIALELVRGHEIAAALARHALAPRIAVGGGDGTLGNAARALIGSRRELAVLPLGTRNHFARQLGIPLDLGRAAALAATGTATAVDVGEAGDRVFLNNASLGAYVELVRRRDASGLPKLLGSLVAGFEVLRRLRPRRYDLVLDGEPRGVSTVQLFVGNNRYEVDEGKPGERHSLQGGVLSVFAAAPLTRRRLVWTAFRVLRGRPDLQQDFALDAEVRELRIERSGTVRIAFDGEDARMPLPLTLRSLPRALRVVAPG